MQDMVKTFEFSHNAPLSKEIIETYNEDGVICLKNAVSDKWLKEIEDGIKLFHKNKRLDNDPSNVTVKYSQDDGMFHYATLMWKSIEQFKSFIFKSGIPLKFGEILETKFINLYYDFLLIKDAGCRSAVTPWHQDQSYYCMNGNKLINCWTALDKIPKETALRFIKKNENTSQVHQAIHFDPDKEYKYTDRSRPPIPNFDDHSKYKILFSEMNPGDTLIWNAKTFHSAPGNHLQSRRAALSINLAGDDVTYNGMKQEPDPPIRGENLKAGSKITCNSFPLLGQFN